MAKPFWNKVRGKTLAQGDLLKNCFVPQFSANFGNAGATETIPVAEADLIIVTQSCDLENNKAILVAMCPTFTLAAFEEHNPKFKTKSQWEQTRKGRIEGLHLLGNPNDADDNSGALVVDFGLIFSLPPAYLETKAESEGERLRLESPFLEHFSQAFARYFMRVGLPSSIPPFK